MRIETLALLAMEDKLMSSGNDPKCSLDDAKEHGEAFLAGLSREAAKSAECSCSDGIGSTGGVRIATFERNSSLRVGFPNFSLSGLHSCLILQN